jgi:hypothetical protein
MRESRLRLLDLRATSTGAAHSSSILDAFKDLSPAIPNRFSCKPCRSRHERVAAVSNRSRLCCRPQSASALVEYWRNHRVLRNDRCLHIHVAPHEDL